MSTHTFIPAGALPACDARGCRFEMRWPGEGRDSEGRITYDVRASNDDALLSHLPPTGAPATYRIPQEWVGDGGKDIWAEIQPWTEALHGPAPLDEAARAGAASGNGGAA